MGKIDNFSRQERKEAINSFPSPFMGIIDKVRSSFKRLGKIAAGATLLTAVSAVPAHAFDLEKHGFVPANSPTLLPPSQVVSQEKYDEMKKTYEAPFKNLGLEMLASLKDKTKPLPPSKSPEVIKEMVQEYKESVRKEQDQNNSSEADSTQIAKVENVKIDEKESIQVASYRDGGKSYQINNEEPSYLYERDGYMKSIFDIAENSFKKPERDSHDSNEEYAEEDQNGSGNTFSSKLLAYLKNSADKKSDKKGEI